MHFVGNVRDDAEEAECSGGGAEVGWVGDHAVGCGGVDVGDGADLVVDGAVLVTAAVADGAVGTTHCYSSVKEVRLRGRKGR